LAATGVKLSADRRAILAGIIDDSSPDDPARITFIEKDRSGGTGPTQLVRLGQVKCRRFVSCGTNPLAG
jgi:hypothetical protein